MMELSGGVLTKLQQEEMQITQKLQELKLNSAKLKQKKKSRGYISSLNTSGHIRCKTWEINELQQSLKDQHVPKRQCQRKDCDTCSPHEKLKTQILKLHKEIHHGSINSVKERQLLKQIKQASQEITKISGNAVAEPTIIYKSLWKTYDSKEAAMDFIKVTSREVEELKLKQMRYSAYKGRLEIERAAVKKEIKILQRKLEKLQVDKQQII